MKKRLFTLFLGVLVATFAFGSVFSLCEGKDKIDIGINDVQQIVNI